jgi:hypothetical protein
MNSPVIDLSLTIDEARALRFEEGRKKYGPVFQGDPLAHLYEELLDALNYWDECRRQGIKVPVGICSVLVYAAHEARAAVRERKRANKR